MFNLSKLEKEMYILELKLQQYDQNLEKLDNQCIQQFTLTYDLCMKIIVQYLEKSSGSPSEVQYLSFEQVVRKAYRVSVISEELQVWKKFKDFNNKIRHGSLQIKTTEAFKMIRHFLDEVKYLLNELKERVKHLE